MDLVSIIMPSYNSSDFIEESINSIKSQTYNNFEAIIIDDCSTDDSVKKITKVIKDDKRFKLIGLSENVGAAEARNIGIMEAKGRFIAFLDSDDLWSPQKLEYQINFMKENKIHFSYSSYEIIKQNGEATGNIVKVPSKIHYKGLLKNTIIGCLTVIIDREKFKYIKMPNIKPEDTATWLELLRCGETAYGYSEVLAKYRLVNGSVSHNKLRAARNLWNMYRKQESIPIPLMIWYFGNYAFNALKKHRKK